MSSINSVIIVGNLGQDPELRHTNSGASTANLSVATSRVWNDKEGNRNEKTEWHRVVVWNKIAENCAKYLKKGSKVGVRGYLDTRSWEDKDGTKRYTTEIIAEDVQFLSTAGEGKGSGVPPRDEEGPAQSRQGNRSGGGARQEAAPSDYQQPSLDDIPF